MIEEQEKNKIKNILENDGVIAFVTDTVWGIGCLPSSKIGVQKIYDIKKRDAKKPLILMSHDIYPLLKYVQPIPKIGQILIKKHFPGALTLVLNKSNLTPDYITSNLDTVGIRVPNNGIFKEICLSISEQVLATTSANISSMPPALNYEQAIEYIGNTVDYIVKDYGFKSKGTASTVCRIFDDNLKIFRQGDIVIKMEK